MPMPAGHNIDSNITRGVNPELDSIFSLPVNHLARFGWGFATIVCDALADRQFKSRLHRQPEVIDIGCVTMLSLILIR